jgi:hypothetical protein
MGVNSTRELLKAGTILKILKGSPCFKRYIKAK